MLRGASAPERVLKWQFSGLFRNRHTWQFRGSYTKDIVISARFSFSPHETRGYSRPDTCLTCEIIQVTFARGAPCCSQRCSDTHWRAWPVLGALLAKKTHTQVEWETKFGRVGKQGQSSGNIVGSSIFEIRCSIFENRCSIQRSKNRLHEKNMIYF